MENNNANDNNIFNDNNIDNNNKSKTSEDALSEKYHIPRSSIGDLSARF